MTEGMELFIDKELRIKLNYIKSHDLCTEIINIEKMIEKFYPTGSEERFKREFPLLNEIQAKILTNMFESEKD